MSQFALSLGDSHITADAGDFSDLYGDIARGCREMGKSRLDLFLGPFCAVPFDPTPKI